jgi:hypothetical protein
MAQVNRLVGSLGAVKIAGTIFAKCRSWEFRPRGEVIKARAAGDPVMVNVPGWLDFELVAEFIVPEAEPYPSQFAALNTSVAFQLMLHAADATATGFIGGEGIITETPATLRYDDVVTFGVTIVPNGNVPTYDLSPLT